MKQTYITFHFLLFLFAVLFYSCEKNPVEIETNEEEQGPYASLEDFYDQKETEAMEFYIDPQQPNQITGNGGIEIYIPGNSLVDPAGQHPTGPVRVLMKEIYDIKSMILSHVPSTSNGNVLQSGGMLYIDFSANSVHYKALYTIIIMPATSVLPEMKIYFGNEDSDIGINWIPADTVTNFVIGDSSGTNPSYYLTVDSLGGWINCARQTLPAVLPLIFIPQVDAWRGETVDIAVYLLYPSTNSCANIANTVGPQSITANNVPVGMGRWVAAIGIGRISKKSYFGLVYSTMTGGPPIPITLTQTQDDEEIATALQAL